MLEQMRSAAASYHDYVSLESALQAYLAHVRVRRKASTVRAAEYHAEVLRAGIGVGFNVAALRPADLDAFVSARQSKGVPPSTINAHLRILRAALHHAEDAGKLAHAPKVKLLRETRTLPTVVGVEQLKGLLEKCDPDARLAVMLAAHAGLRHAEILHLQAGDIDLAGGVLMVRAKSWPGGAWSPKAHAERVVPLNSDLASALASTPREGWLFPGQCGQPRTGLYVAVREAFRGAGLYTARPGLHKLRRTFASRLLARGADVNTVRELGGWADLTTTQRYLVSSDDAKRAAVNKLIGD